MIVYVQLLLGSSLDNSCCPSFHIVRILSLLTPKILYNNLPVIMRMLSKSNNDKFNKNT